LQGDACHLALVYRDVDRVGAVPGKGKLLEIQNEIAGREKELFREFDVERCLHGRDNRVAVLVDKEDVDGMETFLLLAKKDAQRDRALRMNGGKHGGDDGVESAEQAEFSIVIDRGIAQGGDLYFHEARVRDARRICNTGAVASCLGCALAGD